jgi:hypothetical protein
MKREEFAMSLLQDEVCEPAFAIVAMNASKGKQ